MTRPRLVAYGVGLAGTVACTLLALFADSITVRLTNVFLAVTWIAITVSWHLNFLARDALRK